MIVYDDNRRDLAGQIIEILAASTETLGGSSLSNTTNSGDSHHDED